MRLQPRLQSPRRVRRLLLKGLRWISSTPTKLLYKSKSNRLLHSTGTLLPRISNRQFQLTLQIRRRREMTAKLCEDLNVIKQDLAQLTAHNTQQETRLRNQIDRLDIILETAYAFQPSLPFCESLQVSATITNDSTFQPSPC